MNPTLYATAYDLAYVTLSFLISATGAFLALTATAGIQVRGRALSRVNLLAAGVALGGIGIWAMHFIGMLALRVDLGLGYAMMETVLSLLLAIGATAFALWSVARRPTLPQILVSGTVLAAGVCAMHYLGMYGMRFGGYLQWSPLLVAASVLIAWVASVAGLWLAFTVRTLPARALASVIMATAVCAMHYTGMAAAEFICTTATPSAIPSDTGVMSSFELPMLVIVAALGMAGVIGIDQFFQRVARPAQRVVAATQPVRVRR